MQVLHLFSKQNCGGIEIQSLILPFHTVVRYTGLPLIPNGFNRIFYNFDSDFITDSWYQHSHHKQFMHMQRGRDVCIYIYECKDIYQKFPLGSMKYSDQALQYFSAGMGCTSSTACVCGYEPRSHCQWWSSKHANLRVFNLQEVSHSQGGVGTAQDSSKGLI